jgi:hypothetical protein
MNASGLFVMLNGVSGVIGRAYFQHIVTDGSVSQDELDGTRQNLSAIVATLKNTPTDKIEALVAESDELLTEHLDKFNASGVDNLAAFRHAQMMAGYVTTIMAKSGITE